MKKLLHIFSVILLGLNFGCKEEKTTNHFIQSESKMKVEPKKPVQKPEESETFALLDIDQWVELPVYSKSIETGKVKGVKCELSFNLENFDRVIKPGQAIEIKSLSYRLKTKFSGGEFSPNGQIEVSLNAVRKNEFKISNITCVFDDGLRLFKDNSIVDVAIEKIKSSKVFSSNNIIDVNY